jgi:hypothetical protein
MRNCLVTKLNGTVNNDNLPILGKLVFVLEPNQTTATMNWSVLAGSKVTLTGTASAWSDNEAQRIDSNGEFTARSELYAKLKGGSSGGKAIVENKYLLNGFRFNIKPTESINSMLVWYTGQLDNILLSNFYGEDVTAPFRGISGITRFTASDIVNKNILGDISDLAASKDTLARVNVAFSQISGDINNIAGASLTVVSVSLSQVSGDVSSLGACTSLTEVNIMQAQNISGTIDSFATAQVSAGRTSGSCVFIDKGGSRKTITFNSSLPNGYSID